MNAVRLIEEKRDGKAHLPADIAELVDGFVRAEVPDYQMAAWLMAATIRGLDFAETVALTEAMVHSGETLRIQSDRPIVDKHSTGGVGDKVTLVAAPILAALGCAVPKLSGRGLGHTGGTLDKLESIPGFRTQLSPEEFARVVRETGLAIAAQSAAIVPADQKMYALRDVTGTVESLPLIAASIMSKKLAVSSERVVLDVKVGSGAFFSRRETAQAFAELAIAVGAAFGRPVSAVLSAMDAPLGRAIGNAVEVREAIRCLKGDGPEDLREVACAVAGAALSGSFGLTAHDARSRTEAALRDGTALEAFSRWVAAQGGDDGVVRYPERLQLSPDREEIRADRSGYLTALPARAVGDAARLAGAGRLLKTDSVDPGAGIEVLVGPGQAVRVGDAVLRIHGRDPARVSAAAAALAQKIRIADDPVPASSRILGYVGLGDVGVGER